MYLAKLACLVWILYVFVRQTVKYDDAFYASYC